MKNKLLKVGALGFLLLGILIFTKTTFASITPTLSVSGTGNGDSVQISVYGDPNSSVLFYYTKTGTGSQISSLGNTDGNGNFSITISSSTYGITSSSYAHVTIGGLNGPQSPTVTWPIVNSTTNPYPFTLSQMAAVITTGQSSVITASGLNSTLFVSNNTNPSIANVNINGSQITITAITAGSTTATICAAGSSTNCPNVYILVQNGSTQQLSFSQNNISIGSGQNVPISISGGNGLYIISNNSNSSLIQASVSGSVVTLSTQSTSGSASLVICSSDMSACGILNATIGTNTGTISFSQQNPVISIGQNTQISIYGQTNAIYNISSNSNSNIAQATISGSTLNIYGLANGTVNINVCSSLGSCGIVFATIQYVSNGSSLTLSQNSVTTSINQTSSITISGGTPPYNIVNNSSSMFQANITNANTLNVTGISSGTGQLTVCSASGGCTGLSVYVNGSSSNTYTNVSGVSTGTSLTFNQNNPVIPVGQTSSLTIYGGANYYVLYNSNPNNAQAIINGNMLNITGEQNGTAMIVTCSNTSTCGYTIVIIGSLPIPVQTSTVTAYQFTNLLKLGSKGTEVSRLQQKLTDLGMYNGPINGSFGPLTKAAVIKFQKSNGINPVGYVGVSTRNALNN